MISGGMRRPQQFWFKFALVLGCLLGVLLLFQSIFGYFFISRRLIEEQLYREAERQGMALERSVRQLRPQEAAGIATLIQDTARENPQKIAWVRVLDPGGRVVAQAGTPAAAAPEPGQLRKLFEERSRMAKMVETPRGKAMLAVLPLRVPVRPPEAGRAPRVRIGPSFLEIALYAESATRSFGRLHVNLLVSSAGALALLIAMLLLAQRLRAYVRAQQLEQQFAIARQVQSELLPSGTSFCPALECAAACIPAWQVGGDFYDIFATDEGVALVVGDVAGKGLGAALVMSLLHGAIRCTDWMSAAAHENASRQLNRVLCDSTAPATFASLFWAHYQYPMLSYINAGHLPPLLFRASGSVERQVERLSEGGPVLGLLPYAEYHQGRIRFEPGDLLVLYSDGVLEAANAAQEEFGEQRLHAAIRDGLNGSCQELCDAIVARVRNFAQRDTFEDDLTLVLVRALPVKKALEVALAEVEREPVPAQEVPAVLARALEAGSTSPA